MFSEATDSKKIYGSAAELLAALRSGNTQVLELAVGVAKVPCRLINAGEEAKLIVQAKSKASKQNPNGVKLELFESVQLMKDVLASATTIDGAPGLPMGFLDELTSQEIEALYDQYITLNRTINPNIQTLSQDEINELIGGIKKKSLSTKNLFSYQVLAVGKYFLDVIIPSLPTDSVPG